MSLPDFHVSEPFTLGIELEMQVVNPPGFDLSQDSSRLIDDVKPQLTAGEVKHDLPARALIFSPDFPITAPCHGLKPGRNLKDCFGMDGVLTDVNTGDHHRLADDTLRLLENVASSAKKVGATSAITALRQQVKNGHNEAQQMRDFVAKGGSLSGLVKKHCEIWSGL